MKIYVVEIKAFLHIHQGQIQLLKCLAIGLWYWREKTTGILVFMTHLSNFGKCNLNNVASKLTATSVIFPQQII